MPSAAREMVATRPREMDSLLVYRKPPPTLPLVQSPTNSMAAPSPSGSRKRSSMTSEGSSKTSLMPTAIWSALGRALPRQRSESMELVPSARMTTSAVISSSPARTPVTRPDPSLMQLLHGDAADVLGAGLLGLLGQPLVEGAAQHGVGVLALLAELGGGEVDGHLRARVHHGDALVGDLALDGRLGLEVGEDLLEGVGVDAAAGHVLGAGEVAALDDQDGLAGGCGHVSRHAARAARSHDDDVEICTCRYPFIGVPQLAANSLTIETPAPALTIAKM